MKLIKYRGDETVSQLLHVGMTNSDDRALDICDPAPPQAIKN